MAGRLTAMLVATAVVAGGAAFARASPRQPLRLDLSSARSQDAPLLGILFGDVSSGLVRLDPETLRPLPGQPLDLRGSSFGWSFSPDRSRLVLGDNYGHVRFIDVTQMRTLGEIRTKANAPLVVSAWLGERVLAVWHTPRGVGVRVIDASQRRVIRVVALDGSLQAAARTPEELVLLLGPRRGIGGSRLVVVDSEGRTRQVSLVRIRSGRAEPPQTSVGIFRHADAGLAVDPTRRLAFAVAAGAPVAEVDLATLQVSYHALPEPISLLRRVGNFLEPRAEAKGAPDGPDRSALWVGDHTLVTFGSDDHGWVDSARRPQLIVMPAGARLIDTRTWSSTTLEPAATALTAADGALLVTASLWNSGTQKSTGIGLVGYGPDGARRFHLWGDSPVYVQVAGGRAFAGVIGPKRSYAVVDVATGDVVEERDGSQPLLLAGEASTWIP
jgi:hypothetical protein